MSKESDNDSNSDDRTLFEKAVGDVRPVKGKRPHRPKPPPPPRASQRRRTNRDVLAESLQPPPPDADIETGEELRFQRPGVRPRDFRKLRRGEFSIRDEIDLHGMTLGEATNALRAFIDECVAQRDRCVRVVHGKGNRSGPAGPVLKKMVDRELRRWDAVLAFCSAQPRHGGTGAVYVLLKK